jgi:hypothetical protein
MRPRCPDLNDISLETKSDAPAIHERACKLCIEEVDCYGVIHDTVPDGVIAQKAGPQFASSRAII